MIQAPWESDAQYEARQEQSEENHEKWAALRQAAADRFAELLKPVTKKDE